MRLFKMIIVQKSKYCSYNTIDFNNITTILKNAYLIFYY